MLHDLVWIEEIGDKTGLRGPQWPRESSHLSTGATARTTFSPLGETLQKVYLRS